MYSLGNEPKVPERRTTRGCQETFEADSDQTFLVQKISAYSEAPTENPKDFLHCLLLNPKLLAVTGMADLRFAFVGTMINIVEAIRNALHWLGLQYPIPPPHPTTLQLSSDAACDADTLSEWTIICFAM